MSSRDALTLVGSVVVCAALIGQPQIGAPALDERATSPGAAPVLLAAPPIVAAAPPILTAAETASRRPATLVPLYVSFAALQGLDVHSTLRASRFGGREANPVVDSMLGSPAAFVAAKAGTTAGIYFVSERLWKRHRAAAVLTMIALNSTYAAIVARNYAIEARARPAP
jgi:hypothetical protein